MKYSNQEKFTPMKNSADILKSKKVAVIGLGGLGSHSSEYIARMGIGHIVLIDDDVVEESNLSRQGLYYQKDSEEMSLKAEKAAQQLQMMNPDVEITVFANRLKEENIEQYLSGVDLILDGTDNVTTRYLLNDYCYAHHIPWVYASATSSVGTVVNFIPGKTPCFRCVYGNDTSEDSASCDINGVILPILTMITSIQVTEAIKILLDKAPSMEEIRYNIWTREESSVDTSVFAEDDCMCQTQNEWINHTNPSKIYTICSGDTIQVHTDFSFSDLEKKIISKGFVVHQKNEVLFEAKRENNQRIVGFKTGKLVCHQMTKETIQKMF